MPPGFSGTSRPGLPANAKLGSSGISRAGFPKVRVIVHALQVIAIEIALHIEAPIAFFRVRSMKRSARGVRFVQQKY